MSALCINMTTVFVGATWKKQIMAMCFASKKKSRWSYRLWQQLWLKHFAFLQCLSLRISSGKNPALLNVSSPWVLSLVPPVYVWGNFWVLIGKFKVLWLLEIHLELDKPICSQVWSSCDSLHSTHTKWHVSTKNQSSWTKRKLRNKDQFQV